MSQYALVTGGSEGIGLEISKNFATDRINLILVGRNEEKLSKAKDVLQRTNNIEVLTFIQDLSKQDAAESVYDFVTSKDIKISYLINNAGFGVDGEFADQNITDISNLLNLHVVTLTKLTRIFIPDLETTKGRILNVASIAAFQPFPSFNIYAASKVYIYNFSLALRSELRKKGISVSVLCPGVVRTTFYDKDTMNHGLGAFKTWSYTPEFVGRRAYKGMMNRKAAIFPGITTWVYCTIIVKLVPWRLIL